MTGRRLQVWRQMSAARSEAVAALAASFADTTGARPWRRPATRLAVGSDADALVAVLDEVIYVLDTQGGVPRTAELTPAPDGLHLALHLARIDEVEVTGAVPKAVTLHELRFDRSVTGWSCAVTIDV